MKRTTKLALLILILTQGGCATQRMIATANCTFTPGVKEGRYYTWIVPGDAKCTLVLNSPIIKPEDTKTFAEGFKTLMGYAPQIEIKENK